MLTASQVADWMLAKAEQNNVLDVTNMKLNKLVFFAQAHHLAATGYPLFADEILAWEYGPVIDSLYRKYSSYHRNPIPATSQSPVLDSGEQEILDQVFDRYGYLTASQLSDESHTPIWDKHHEGHYRMPVDEIRDYYHRRSTIKSTECVYFSDAELSAMDEALSSDEQLADARKLLGIC